MTLMQPQRDKVIELLWDSLKPVKGYGDDRRQTGWGNKTKLGLIACLESIINEGGSDEQHS